MDKETIIEFRKTTKQVSWTSVKAKYPGREERCIDSQEEFLAELRRLARRPFSAVTPWPYETFVGGRTTE